MKWLLNVRPTAWGIVFTLLAGYAMFSLALLLMVMRGLPEHLAIGLLWGVGFFLALIIVAMGMKHVIE